MKNKEGIFHGGGGVDLCGGGAPKVSSAKSRGPVPAAQTGTARSHGLLPLHTTLLMATTSYSSLTYKYKTVTIENIGHLNINIGMWANLLDLRFLKDMQEL